MVPMIPRPDFDSLWGVGDMPAKIASGKFREQVLRDTPATNPKYLGGRSLLIKLVTDRENHIGTIHRIVMPDGSIPHEHPKDYTLRDCSRVRIPEPGQ
jgi:hypothetical protein